MRLILFDWDGTIVDSMAALYATNGAICARMGIPLDLATYRRAFSPNWRLMYRTLGIPDDRVDEANLIWQSAFDAGAMAPFDGVCEALHRLAARGMTLGVVTSGDRGEVEPQLTRLGIADLVAVRVYGDDTHAGKPDPAPLVAALSRAGGVSREEAVYIGDALDDMRMARAAGIRGVGVTSLVTDAAELLGAGASEAVDSVVEWVKRTFRESADGETPLLDGSGQG